MTETRRKPVVSYHTHCLQDDAALAPPGPGAFAVILRNEFRVNSPHDAQVMCLSAGTPLLGQAQVDNLSEAVHQHLDGSIAGSDLRMGVALFLGHDPDQRMDDSRVAIDTWLGTNTAFVFWPRSDGVAKAAQDGFFAGIAEAWASRTDALN